MVGSRPTSRRPSWRSTGPRPGQRRRAQLSGCPVVANQYQLSVPPPFVPGSEFAGVVAEVAAGVTSVAVGDRVTGTCLIGAFAEEVVVAAEALAPIPDGVDERVAAGFGVAHRTAYHVLRSIAPVRPGDELVVLGAGGGVGLAVVELGAVLGARVTARPPRPTTSSRWRRNRARRSWSTIVPDSFASYCAEAVPDGSDAVIDPVGGDLAEPALRFAALGRAVRDRGLRLRDHPPHPAQPGASEKGVHILGFQFASFAEHAPDQLRRNEQELIALLDPRHRLRPHIGATFALEDVGAAMRMVADGRAIGKVNTRGLRNMLRPMKVGRPWR